MNYPPSTETVFVVRRKSDGKFETHSGDVAGRTEWVADVRHAYPFRGPGIPLKYIKEDMEVVSVIWEPHIHKLDCQLNVITTGDNTVCTCGGVTS